MATVTGITAARAAEIEAASIVDGEIIGDNLFLTRFDSTQIDAGVVKGDQGDPGPQGDPGVDGLSVPAGGTAGQRLVKLSSTDYDYAWSFALQALVLNTQVASYTLQIGDEEDMVLVDNASATVVTVPLNSVAAFPLGTRIRIAQIGLGDVSIAGSPGVTLRYASPLTPTLLGRGATVEVIKVSTDIWLLDGHGNLATTDLGFQTFTPNIVATTSGPNFGTSPSKTGYYIEDSQKRVIGGATVRWDTAGSPSRGNGVYRLLLPVQGVNYDAEDYSPIGAASVGINLVHNVGLLHFNGVTPNTTHAVIAVEGGLFATNAVPAGSASGMNVHYHFAYQAA